MYSLQSKNFEKDIYTSWKDLQEEKHLCDVTLACEDNQVEAHRVILSACSPVFNNLLRQNRHHHPLLYLRGVKYSELVNMLDFMYQGEVSIAQDDLNDFLDVGQDLKIRGITDDGEKEDKECNKENDLNVDDASEQNIHISEPYTFIKYINEESVPIVITNPSSENNSEIPEITENPLPPEEPNFSEETLNYDTLNIKAEPPEPIIEPMTVLFDLGDASDDDCDMTEAGVVAQNDGELKDVKHYYCEKCDYESVNRGDLRRHVSAKHKKVRFSCKQKNCKFKTAKKKLLKRHVDVVHKKYELSCKQCRFTTNNKDALINHMKIQHKEDLVNHMRTNSAQQKPLTPLVMQSKPTNQNIFKSKAVQQFVEQRILQSKLVPPSQAPPKPVTELHHRSSELRRKSSELRQSSNTTKPPTRSSSRIAKKPAEPTEAFTENIDSTPKAPLTTHAKIEKIEKTLSNNKQSSGSGGSDLKDKLQTLLGNISVSIIKH